MITINKKFLGIALAVGSLLTMSSAFAAEVTFPVGQKNGSFSCTVSNLSQDAVVAIDTHSVDAQGFCGGGYVTSPGHMRIPGAEATNFFNTYYFQIQKSATKQGSVSVTLAQGTGNITCTSGHGSANQLFAPGAKYCALPPK